MNFVTKDIDVIKFVSAAGITGGTEFSAINYLVLSLKKNNLWNRIHALYPFVGGTESTHKFNLKNPVGTNAGFRLTFSGSVTHDSNGVTYSSVNGCSNTFLSPSTTITLNRETMAVYSRSSFSGASGGIDMGAATTTTQRSELTIRSNLDGYGASINSTTAGNRSVTGITNGAGFFMASRQVSTDLRIYINGSQTGSTQTSLNNGTRTARQMYIGCRNVLDVPQGFTGRNFSLALIGAEYTPSEASTWYTIVQQYNTMLNRQV